MHIPTFFFPRAQRLYLTFRAGLAGVLNAPHRNSGGTRSDALDLLTGLLAGCGAKIYYGAVVAPRHAASADANQTGAKIAARKVRRNVDANQWTPTKRALIARSYR